MSVDEKVELNETCDSCGCFAEIGTIIGEGDDVMDLVIEAAPRRMPAPSWLPMKLWPTGHCRSSSEQRTDQGANGVILKARLQFTCTAEKLIFEMRARSI